MVDEKVLGLVNQIGQVAAILIGDGGTIADELVDLKMKQVPRRIKG